MEIGRSLDPKLSRAYSTFIHRTRGIATGKGTTATRQLPRSRNFKLTDTPRYDIPARQRTLVGNPLNDEEWSDDLFNPSYQKTCPKTTTVRKRGPESE